MTPPSNQGGRRGRAETRRDIIQAALARFTRQGYHNTTMDDIVAESGLSKGTLYWYFDSKENLFQAALLSVFEGFAEEMVAEMDRCDTAVGKLRYLADSAASFGESVGGYFGLFLEYWGSRPHRDEADRVWYDLLHEYQQILSTVVEEGVESGEFREVDAEALIWAFMATYDGLAAYASFVPELDLQRVNHTFTDVILEGLRADA